LTQSIQASVRLVAPVMTFILLIGLAQMAFGKVPRRACVVVGALLFPICAWIDPLFDGRIRIQIVEPIDLFWLVTSGAVAGYLGGVLLAGLFLVADQVRSLRGSAEYSFPRRFGMGTLLLATTLFAMLFAVLQWARVRPEQLFFYALFVATVSLAQMVFERSPRWASVLAGGVYLPLSMMLIPMIRGRPVFREGDTGSTVVTWVLIGLFVGYAGGALIAGVFLASDFLSRIVSRRQDSPPSTV
jgi:hypothetical protein